MIPVMTAAMQEQYGLYAALDKRVSDLKADNDNLRAEVTELKKARK